MWGGNQLTRPGLTLLQNELGRDKNISHVLIPRRDRLARPDDALEGMRLEAQFQKLGVTLMFMDRVVKPAARGERADVGGLIVGLFDYHQAGKERQDLARKVIYAQIALAQAGYSIGGRPPYGFRRWLVRDDGTQAREWSDGERVRMRGHPRVRRERMPLSADLLLSLVHTSVPTVADRQIGIPPI